MEGMGDRRDRRVIGGEMRKDVEIVQEIWGGGLGGGGAGSRVGGWEGSWV